MRTFKLTFALPLLALLFPALALAGTKSYTTPGTYTFTVPQYTGTLTVAAIGGGGGGGGGAMGADTFPGGSGTKAGDVSFGSIIARGGLGGCGGAIANPYSYTYDANRNQTTTLSCNTVEGVFADGARTFTGTGDGTASGGDTNTKGGGAAGGAGGVGAQDAIGYDGGGVNSSRGSNGGVGGKAVKTYTLSQLAPGTTVTVVIGTGRVGGPIASSPMRATSPYNGGAGGINGCADPSQPGALGGCGGTYASGPGEDGQDGGVTITWTDASQQLCSDGSVPSGGDIDNCPTSGGNLSCSVTFDQNPLTGSATTMRWTSTGAELFYINQVGWVGASGSAQVSSPGDYSGTVSASGGSGTGSSPGSQSYTTPGTYTFTVPDYTGTLSVMVKGAGGGGGGSSGLLGGRGGTGSTGGLSSFGAISSRGGGAGTGGSWNGEEYTPGSSGTPGTSSGGDTNTTGGGASGGAGGGSATEDPVARGDGDVGGTTAPSAVGGNGGYGGRATKMYSTGALAPGSTVSVSVGRGGAGGAGGVGACGPDGCNGVSGFAGGTGQNGSITITWAGAGTDGDGGTASCPAILRGTPSSCTPTSQTCRPNHNLVDSCGNTTVCRYGCSTQTNQCLTRETCVPYGVCNASGTKVVNVCDNATVDDCSARGSGWICSAGACRISAIGFQPFTGTNKGGQTFNATGHLQAVPALVRGGETVRIYWNTVNARTCTILGSNGDGAEGSPTGVWNTVFSGTTGKTTSPISAQTTYTLLCHAFAGVIPPIVRESAIVNIIPSFQEL